MLLLLARTKKKKREPDGGSRRRLRGRVAAAAAAVGVPSSERQQQNGEGGGEKERESRHGARAAVNADARHDHVRSSGAARAAARRIGRGELRPDRRVRRPPKGGATEPALLSSLSLSLCSIAPEPD